MNEDLFRFRPLSDDEVPLLWEWLNRPHVREWWTPPASLPAARREYLPDETYGAARPYLAWLGDAPIGYIQYYVVAEGDADWWPDDPGPGTVGIDQFLAADNLLGRGLGTKMVREFAAFLFRDPQVTEIRVDPRPDNRRAVRCYEKAGFRTIGPITTPDGDALMMVLHRPTTPPSDC